MTPVGVTVAGINTDTKNHTMVHSGALVSHSLLRPLTSAAAPAVIVPLSSFVLDHSSSTSLPPVSRLASLKPFVTRSATSIQLHPSKSVLSSSSPSAAHTEKHTSIETVPEGQLLLDNSNAATAWEARKVLKSLDCRPIPTRKVLVVRVSSSVRVASLTKHRSLYPSAHFRRSLTSRSVAVLCSA